VPPNGEIAAGSTNALYILTEAYGLNKKKVRIIIQNSVVELFFYIFPQKKQRFQKI
jgi:hypothetical protein